MLITVLPHEHVIFMFEHADYPIKITTAAVVQLLLQAAHTIHPVCLPVASPPGQSILSPSWSKRQLDTFGEPTTEFILRCCLSEPWWKKGGRDGRFLIEYNLKLRSEVDPAHLPWKTAPNWNHCVHYSIVVRNWWAVIDEEELKMISGAWWSEASTIVIRLTASTIRLPGSPLLIIYIHASLSCDKKSTRWRENLSSVTMDRDHRWRIVHGSAAL